MASKSFFIACLAFLMAMTSTSASVFLPYDVKRSSHVGSKVTKSHENSDFARRELTRMRQSYSTNGAAMAIPGYGVTEQIFVGGFMNFLSIYNIVITARVLLSWFPQAQGIGVLQPVYQITDPYLNLFRGIIPPVFGLDLSPLLAFFLLNVLTNVTAAVGSEVTPEQRVMLKKKYSPFAKKSVNTIAFVH
jgi:YggT family protein